MRNDKLTGKIASILTFLLLLVLTGCSMDKAFIFFPIREMVTTPKSAGLTYEDVYFTSADGAGLHGWFIPGDPQAPVVLFFHGDAGNISHRIHNLRLLHQHLGVSVFIFDYRGYGNSTGQPSEEATYADARGALTWLHERGLRNDQLIYFGRSLGAAVALQLAIESPPAGVILESAFTSVAAMGREHNPILYLLFGWALKSRYDNLSKIDRLTVPLLLFHGDKDTIVPSAMAQQLFNRSCQPKTLHLIAGAGHNDTLSHQQKDYWQAWRTYIDRVTARRPDSAATGTP